MPATPADAKGLLIAAIRDDNPVVFLEQIPLYNVAGPVPAGEYVVPIAKPQSGSRAAMSHWRASDAACTTRLRA